MEAREEIYREDEEASQFYQRLKNDGFQPAEFLMSETEMRLCELAEIVWGARVVEREVFAADGSMDWLSYRLEKVHRYRGMVSPREFVRERLFKERAVPEWGGRSNQLRWLSEEEWEEEVGKRG